MYFGDGFERWVSGGQFTIYANGGCDTAAAIGKVKQTAIHKVAYRMVRAPRARIQTLTYVLRLTTGPVKRNEGEIDKPTENK
jgi:hypothetical protein